MSDPKSVFFNRSRVLTREIDELIGLCKGLTADNVVVYEEAVFLKNWLDKHRQSASVWPGNLIYGRLQEMLADGILNENEKAELLNILKSFSGDQPLEDLEIERSSKLPLNNPPPEISFPGKSFCLTGTFIFGSRKECQFEIVKHGGIIAERVTKQLDYLIVGFFSSEGWIHSIWGTKVQKAMDYRDSGLPIAIIGEKHWQSFLK